MLACSPKLKVLLGLSINEVSSDVMNQLALSVAV